MSPSNTQLPPRKRAGVNKQPNVVKSKNKKHKKKKSPFKSFLKFLLIVIILAILAVAVYVGSMALKVDNTILDTGNDNQVAPEASAKIKPVTMLLLGTDYRPKTGTHLTDVMMVAAFNPETKSATVVSIPRDTRIDLDGYKVRKANAYYPNFLDVASDSGIPALDEMKVMFAKYMDIPIDYAMVINFQGFSDVVDALGGVNVNISMDMCYKDNADGTDIDLTEGPAKLDGEDALGYVRYRKSSSGCKPRTKESDDFSRNERQNEVLHSLIDQMQTFSGVTKLGKVIDAVDENMEIDMEQAQLKNMIATYWNISKDNVKFMPVTGNWKSPYVYLDDEVVDKAKQALKDEIAGNSLSTLSSSEESEAINP
ncbi:LCP family protein [Paenibacillus crassostreae]|uniref:Transcriptional regulator n=1 Tax=Paenibacillus crassostreae TaxID=1763538 RepID=A0A162RKM6_9BACL|nr:LCP family protein [Paenibacillus crassostreae]AOZ91701.1 transcriptional regulator [Paenibacillus crassostreae]OAB72727.1 transcriptional regulator [Paenibacillus crassostreae]